MRLYEFNSSIPKVLSLVSHLKQMGGENKNVRVKTASFLNMLKNVGISMNKASLDKLLNDDNNLKSYISSIEDDYITLNMTGDVPDDGIDDLDNIDMGDEVDDLGDDDLDDDGMDQDNMGMPGDETDGLSGGEYNPDFDTDMDIDKGADQTRVSNMAKRALLRRT